MADDWRVTVTFGDAAQARRAAQSVRDREVADDVRGRLGHRVAVSADGPRLFLYAATGDAAREAEQVVRDVLAGLQLHAEFALDRWHPVAQEWADASVPLPETDEQRQEEHRRRIEGETEESLATGQAGFEVRVELRTHRQAVQLAARLEAEGHPVVRRWKYLILGADNEDDAAALAETISREMPVDASLHTQAVPFVQFRGGATGRGEPPG